MAKKTMMDIEREKERQNKRYQWIVEKSKVFNKDIIYKYYEANTADPKYIAELKAAGKFEEKAVSWWIGNMFIGMEAGVYDETNFTEEKYIEVKENFELPRIKELRTRTIAWVGRQLHKTNPELEKTLLEYGVNFNYGEYAGAAGNFTQILLPSNVGTLLLLYDPSNQTFQVQSV